MNTCCEQCGAQVSVSSTGVGSTYTCPACGHTAALGPLLPTEAPATETPTASVTWSDDVFAPGPPAEPERDAIDSIAPSARQNPPAVRPYPWFLDIWLYPFGPSTLGLALVMVGVPMLISLLAWLSYAVVIALTFLLPFTVAIMGLCMIGLLVIDLLLVWYFCECVRESAAGSLRVPDTLGRSPDHMELLGQGVTLTVGSLLYWVATMLCFSYVASPWIKGAVLVLTATTFPLALLRAIMDESMSGFNPLPLVPMIWQTRAHYPAAVLATGILFVLPTWGLYTWCAPLMNAWWWTFLLSPLVLPALYYPLLVLAHIWGRYYDRHAETLA